MNRCCSRQDVSIAIFILFLFQSAIISPAYAQMDWLKSGKELLDTVSTPQEQTTPQISDLTDSDLASGLKDALRVGTERVVGQLGKADGFNADPAIHIPLPDNMLRVKQALDAIGLTAMMDDLELKLNRAAEAATPPAKNSQHTLSSYLVYTVASGSTINRATSSGSCIGIKWLSCGRYTSRALGNCAAS